VKRPRGEHCPGLPIVRASVDHGTVIGSLQAALQTAMEIARLRSAV
jgi:4-hydroxy-L-threonine phosphate dehydrogenase PdxA